MVSNGPEGERWENRGVHKPTPGENTQKRAAVSGGF
jgi:hypothetical protein